MHVLVPVEILEGESVSAGLVELLGTAAVTVLGYHVLPEQTPPDQARAQFEDRALEALEDVTEQFRTAGGPADHRLVFTHDRRQTFDRVTEEEGADAYVIPGATGDVERLLVPVSGAVDVDRLLWFVRTLVGERPIGVTLVLAAPDGEATQEILTPAANELAAAGIDVETREESVRPRKAIVDALPGHDAVVMGERAPSLASLVFGEESERVAAASIGPVLVVRRKGEEG